MKFSLTALFFLFCTSGFAQQIHGKVSDATTKLPIANAQIITKTITVFADAEGKFILQETRVGETIGIRLMGYEAIEVTLTPEMVKDGLTVYLKSNYISLQTVTIKTPRNYKRDSLDLRKTYAKAFAYKDPGIYDVFAKKSANATATSNRNPNSTSSLIGIDVLKVVNLLGKKTSADNKFKQLLLKDEELNYIDHVFSKEKITSITALEGDSLNTFMQRYRPSSLALKKMTGYELNLYIKKSYSEFIKPR